MSETTIKTQEILDRVKTVRALSPGAGQLLDLLDRPDHDPSGIVQAIETDPGLTVNVLRTVNSAAMGLRREIQSVQEAVAFLGETKVMGIALSAAAGEFYNAELAGYQGSRGDLGRHCLWTALAARELARHTGDRVDPATAFTAGLLHDIGKAIISDFLAEEVDDLARLRDQLTDGDQLELENTVIGTNHCEVGQAMARRWRMPGALVSGIQFHHTPEVAPAGHMATAYVVHMADMLAMMFGHGTGADDMQYELDPAYREHVDIDSDGLEALVLDVQLNFKATAEALFGGNGETEA